MIKTRLIYNPRAGVKWPEFFNNPQTRLYNLYALFYKYEIDFESTPTSQPGDVLKLAREAAQLGFDRVIVAGGDGTVSEAANGLIDSQTALGILPFGTYMNVARMLSIPFDLEAAVMTIKIGKTRTIDVGEIIYLNDKIVNGEKNNDRWYFLESAGVGMEAELHKEFLSLKQGNKKAVLGIIKALSRNHLEPLKIELDDNQSFETNTRIALISNGLYTGAGIPAGGKAKLNDHLLTLHLYNMSKIKLLKYLLKIKLLGPEFNINDINNYSKFIRISSKENRSVHADGRIFGKTPVELSIKPNALKVIVGFPETPADSGLLAQTNKRSYIY